jgi:hypothetical protein
MRRQGHGHVRFKAGYATSLSCLKISGGASGETPTRRMVGVRFDGGGRRCGAGGKGQGACQNDRQPVDGWVHRLSSCLRPFLRCGATGSTAHQRGRIRAATVIARTRPIVALPDQRYLRSDSQDGSSIHLIFSLISSSDSLMVLMKVADPVHHLGISRRHGDAQRFVGKRGDQRDQPVVGMLAAATARRRGSRRPGRPPCW